MSGEPLSIEKLMRPEEQERIGTALLSEEQRQALLEWGMRMFSLGQHIVGDIDEVKYDGRLVILDDGSRWEVDAVDAATADMWGPMDRVVIIDDEMYRIDDTEKVAVQEDLP
jgi:hypothetical protein